MKKIFLLFFVLIISMVYQLSAQDKQDKNDYEKRPFQITFFPPLSTNGVYAPQIVNEFSLNILAGVSAGVDAFEAGGFMNINRDYVEGAQFAGFGNINGGSVNGVQMAGFTNINGGMTNGVQAAGFMNINGNSKELVQLAGFLNGSGDVEGFQAAGFMNFSKDIDGAQAAGFMNIAEKTDGAQAAGFMNVAEEVDGVQLAGFMNVAGKVDGAMISGFINICDSIDGVPISFINIVRKNGYRRFEVWSNETYYINLAYKIGIREFYTIFNFGMRPGQADYQFATGVGFGTNILFDEKKSLDIEGIHYHLVRERFWDDDYNYNYEYNSLNQLRVSFNYHLDHRRTIFAGPTMNVLVALNPAADRVAPNWGIKFRERYDNKTMGWFGFNAGVRF